MNQPEGLQTELLKLSRPVRNWVLELAGMAVPDEERTGCSCCDPTASSPDPVVVDWKFRAEKAESGLRKVNKLAEHYERLWYLRGDEIEKLERELAEAKHLLADQFGYATFVALRDMYDKAKSNAECAEILRLYCKDGEGFWKKAGGRP